MEPATLLPTLRPLMEAGEQVVTIQNKVGLYKGMARDQEHDNGTVYLTTHRIVYVDQQWPREKSVSLDLSLLQRCSIHSGFLYSSGKISLYLRPLADDAEIGAASNSQFNQQQTVTTETSLQEWKCPICDAININDSKCILCGVKRPENIQNDSDIERATTVPGEDEPARCPTCTFDNHGSMTRCEMCDSPLTVVTAGSDNSNNDEPELIDFTEGAGAQQSLQDLAIDDSAKKYSLIRMSFRGGGSTTFHAALKDVLGRRQWDVAEDASSAINTDRSNTPLFIADNKNNQLRQRAGGISAIVNVSNETGRARDVTLRSAFSDLDALTTMAKDIVGMAEHISTQLGSPSAAKNKKNKLRSNGDDDDDDDDVERADAFQKYLLALGIDSPVTRDTAGAVFHEELARELCDFLESYVSQHGGSVPLVDAYCLYNRAREFTLVYPSDFVQACQKFATLGLSLRLREYPSGLLALEDSGSASDEVIVSRVSSYIENFGPISANDLATIEDCPLALAEERLWLCERGGHLCRDESVEGVRFYKNPFLPTATLSCC